MSLPFKKIARGVLTLSCSISVVCLTSRIALAAPDGPAPNPDITVSLPTVCTSVAVGALINAPVTTTLIDPTTTGGNNYVGFQGDFVFDSAVIGFATGGTNGPPVARAGLTSDPNWTISGGILSGPGPTPGTLKILSLIHISEPTRLLSISYAVFCLKKKKI